MSATLNDLLASTVARREREFGDTMAFASAHAVPITRSIRTRRAVTYTGIGGLAAVMTAGAALGVRASSGADAGPAGGGSSDTYSVSVNPNGLTEVMTSLVRVPLDPAACGGVCSTYVYYATLGNVEMVPFPGGGLWYPGIPDVPADAFIVMVGGDGDGYDADAPGSQAYVGAISLAAPEQGDLIGTRTNASGPISWDTFGRVSDDTAWGVHYYLVDGVLVTEEEGMDNPAAVRVTATYTPGSASPTP